MHEANFVSIDLNWPIPTSPSMLITKNKICRVYYCCGNFKQQCFLNFEKGASRIIGRRIALDLEGSQGFLHNFPHKISRCIVCILQVVKHSGMFESQCS